MEDLNKLTVTQCEEILELTGVDVMAPPELVSFARRYAALGFYKRHQAGDPITFAQVLSEPMANAVGAMTAKPNGRGVDPTAARPKRAASRKVARNGPASG